MGFLVQPKGCKLFHGRQYCVNQTSNIFIYLKTKLVQSDKVRFKILIILLRITPDNPLIPISGLHKLTTKLNRLKKVMDFTFTIRGVYEDYADDGLWVAGRF